MQWHTVTRLGEKQSLTPEGFLLARDVPIARTGTQLYHPAELAIAGLHIDGPGPIAVEREPTAVFHPRSVASYAGKPVTLDHPFGRVDPGNWRDLAIGSVHDPRPDPDNGVLLADLLFTDQRGIGAVRSGTRAVSVGYDAEYEPIGANRARQRNIVCNHIALVDEGRCGATCMIGDSAMTITRDQQPDTSPGGLRPGSPVGPFKKHGRFRGRSTGAFILPDPDDPDFFILWEGTPAEGLLTPGNTMAGNVGTLAFTGDAFERDVLARRAVEAQRQRAELKRINQHNRRQWGT